MTGIHYVVGAGVAGMAAALDLVSRGHEVHLLDSAGQAGGRCRAVQDKDGGSFDNGTHVLLGINRRALAMLDRTDARDRWLEPEPDGLPLVDVRTGNAHRVSLTPASWLVPAYRPPGMRLAHLARLAAMTLRRSDRPVADGMPHDAFFESVVEPLTIAALNTPTKDASTRTLARVLRRLVLPGAGRLLVARHGLGPDLVDPATETLRQAGCTIRFNQRLTQIEHDGARVTRLQFAGHGVDIGDNDRVVLALPPSVTGKLLPGLTVPDRFEAIVNLHFPCSYEGEPRFVGLLGGMGQWVLFRRHRVAVTISAARGFVDLPAAQLASDGWSDVLMAASRIPGLDLPPQPPSFQVIKERRATLSHRWDDDRRTSLRSFDNLALAGDWLSPLPATIEAAVQTGEKAARLVAPGKGGLRLASGRSGRKMAWKARL